MPQVAETVILKAEVSIAMVTSSKVGNPDKNSAVNGKRKKWSSTGYRGNSWDFYYKYVLKLPNGSRDSYESLGGSIFLDVFFFQEVSPPTCWSASVPVRRLSTTGRSKSQSRFILPPRQNCHLIIPSYSMYIYIYIWLNFVVNSNWTLCCLSISLARGSWFLQQWYGKLIESFQESYNTHLEHTPGNDERNLLIAC